MQQSWLRKKWIVLFWKVLLIYPIQASAATHLQPKTDTGRWLLRFMWLEVAPVDMTSKISNIGGRVQTSRKRVPGMDLSFFVTEHWVTELQGGPFERDYRIIDSSLGDFQVGTIRNFALSLTLQYHFYPTDQWSPYIGLGINHAWTREVRNATGIPEFDVKDITSGILNAGLDYRLNPRWSLSTSLRYLISPDYHFEGQGFNSVVSMNTLVIGGGLSYRF